MRIKGITIFGIITCLLFFSIKFIVAPIYHFYTDNGLSGSSYDVLVVKRSSTAWDVIQELHRRKMIKHPLVVYYFCRLNGSADNIKAGVYSISNEDTPAYIMQKVENAKVLELPFTIIAGKRWVDIKRDLFHAQWLNVETNNKFMLLGKPIENPEGLLLADTYLYDANSRSDQLLERANRALDQYLEHRWETRAANLPYHNAYEMLIAASIIEKETAVPKERPLIASVIVNRLRRHMRLQMDPTVIYAMKEQWQGSLSKTDLKVDSPYNTYRNYGLPPTPIAMVSRASIDAASHPDNTDFLYFVAKGDGTHQFSSNYTQQQIAVQRYIKRGS